MVELGFDARSHRLSVAGGCSVQDCPRIVEAMESFADLAQVLVLDLSPLSSLPLEVAATLVEACRELEQDGVRVDVTVINDHPVARRWQMAQAERGQPQPAE